MLNQKLPSTVSGKYYNPELAYSDTKNNTECADSENNRELEILNLN